MRTSLTRRLGYVTVAMLMAVGVLGGVTGAQAMPSKTDTVSAVRSERPEPIVLRRVPISAEESSCLISMYGYDGWFICETEFSEYEWSSTNVEVFIIGLNREVYHIWKGSGGWKRLYGTARATNNGAYWFGSPSFGVWTYGPDNNRWCKYRGNGSWPGDWKRC